MPIPRSEVDPRGLRFAAAVTTVVLAASLLAQSAWLLAFQAGVFALGALGGVRWSPYSTLFVRIVRPRLSTSVETEDSRPPQFAQLVGLLFSLVGLVGYTTGLTTLALAATGFALGAAFLNAAFGLCLGCEFYLVIQRILPDSGRTRATTTEVSA